MFLEPGKILTQMSSGLEKLKKEWNRRRYYKKNVLKKGTEIRTDGRT